MKKSAAVLATFAVLGTVVALAQPATPPAPAPAAATPPDSPARAERRALMRSNQQTVTQINEIVIGIMDPAGLKTRLQVLVENGKKIQAAFAPGTDQVDQGAKPEIWTNAAGFKAANDKFIAAIPKVVAGIPDRVKLAEAMRDLQAECGACHTAFRVMPAAAEGRGRGGRGRGAAPVAAAAANAEVAAPADAAPANN